MPVMKLPHFFTSLFKTCIYQRYTVIQLQTAMASRLARVALLRTRVKPSSTYNVQSISSRRSLHLTPGMMDGPTVLPDEFMEQAQKEGEEKEKARREGDREEEIKLELLDASLKQLWLR